jgi:hypothetical protein
MEVRWGGVVIGWKALTVGSSLGFSVAWRRNLPRPRVECTRGNRGSQETSRLKTDLLRRVVLAGILLLRSAPVAKREGGWTQLRLVSLDVLKAVMG